MSNTTAAGTAAAHQELQLNSMAPSHQRVLFISLEFADPCFSGNGTYSRSLVRGLLKIGCSVAVICASPQCDGQRIQRIAWPTACDADCSPCSQKAEVHVVSVPSELWRRVDMNGSWKSWASSIADGVFTQCFSRRSFELCFYVDWSGFVALTALKRSTPDLSLAVEVYMNYRVFSQPVNCANSDQANFYMEHERAAMHHATMTVALCHADAETLQALQRDDHRGNTAVAASSPVTFLMCPVRDEILRVSSSVAKSCGGLSARSMLAARKYLTCCVRLSEEKNALFFVEVIEELARNDVLREHCIIPALCGAASDAKYAEAVRSRLTSICPDALVMEHFLPPEELGNLFLSTALNFHPPLYDAFGLTVMEAAVFGAPSIIHCPRHRNVSDGSNNVSHHHPAIGVASLLPVEKCCIGCDFNEGSVAVARRIHELLSDARDGVLDEKGAETCELLRFARAARHVAVLRDEVQCARELMVICATVCV